MYGSEPQNYRHVDLQLAALDELTAPTPGSASQIWNTIHLRPPALRIPIRSLPDGDAVGGANPVELPFAANVVV